MGRGTDRETKEERDRERSRVLAFPKSFDYSFATAEQFSMMVHVAIPCPMHMV
mgnify:CR=1 FL=1